MDKPAIKKFAIWARNKLIADTKYRAGLVGVTETAAAEPLPQSNETVQFFDVGLPQPYRIEGEAVTQRQRFVAELNKETAKQGSYTAAYQTVVDKVAYTWFNRLIAVRYMEVNDLLPSRTRVLSSADGRAEPQIVTSPFDALLDYTPAEQQQIVSLKNDNKLDEAFRLLFLKQCAALGDCLPRLFEQVDDYMPLLLALSFTDKDGVVCHLVNDIPESDWQDAVQIVGWLYQYYNTEPKEQVFANLKKNIKISKENIPAATQLFTPDWIVRYMVENSLGRLYVESVVSSQWSGASGQWSEENEKERIEKEKEIAEQMGWKYYLPEAEQSSVVREQCSVISGQCSVDSDQTDHSPLSTDHYPLTTLKCIDPCMGSGHILAYLFDVLMQIYTAAGYSKRDAAASIVEHNLYGLDIDDRAAQMAYFVVMMKGCQYDSRFLRRHLNPHVYAIQESGELPQTAFGYCGPEEPTARTLWDTFRNAKEYGSILQPKVTLEELDKLEARLQEADRMAGYGSLGVQGLTYQLLDVMYPLIDQARMLVQKYDVVVTNPPYMGSSGMNAKLSDYVKKYYPDSKSDLFAVFIERCAQMDKRGGYQAMITQHAWMFLSSFEKLREKLQRIDTVNMAHLGARGFDEIGGEVVQTTSFVMRNSHIKGYKGTYCRLIDGGSEKEKAEMFVSGKKRYVAEQDSFSKIPGSPVAYWVSETVRKDFSETTLNDLCPPKAGLSTADNDRFLRFFWEVDFHKIYFLGKSREDLKKLGNKKWIPMTKGGNFRKWYGNNEYVLNFANDGEELKYWLEHNPKDPKTKSYSRYIRNYDMYLQTGYSFNDVSAGQTSFRYQPNGYIPNARGPFVYSTSKELLGYLNSNVCLMFLNIIAPTLTYNVGDVCKIPYKNIEDITIAERVDLNIEDAKEDWDSFETSWDFDEHPLIALRNGAGYGTDFRKWSYRVEDSYRAWEMVCNDRFNELKNNEEELNRIFIDIYGLQDELNPEVEDKDVTVRKADLARDIRSLISYAVGCIFGRYSLDKAGLVFAGGDFDKIYWKYKGQAALDENGEPIGGGYAGISLAEYHYPKFHDTDDWETATSLTFEPDVDNVIPITDEEYFTDDLTGLFVAWVKKAFGQDYLEQNLAFIAKALGVKGTSPRAVIRNYFLNGFYADHVKIYQKRPIYWLYDSGKQNGFKALIYMHRYNADTSGLVRADYLYKMEQVYESEIARMEDEIAHGASREVAQATKRKEKLVKQLKECKDYDDRLGHIALARIPIDLDDGVKANYDKVQTGVDGKKLAILAKI